MRRRRRTSCCVKLRRSHPQRTGSTLAVRPPRFPGMRPIGAGTRLPPLRSGRQTPQVQTEIVLHSHHRRWRMEEIPASRRLYFPLSLSLCFPDSISLVDRRGLEPTRPKSLAARGSRGCVSRPPTVPGAGPSACSASLRTLALRSRSRGGLRRLPLFSSPALLCGMAVGGPPGTRTPNQRIKSPLLYRLS